MCTGVYTYNLNSEENRMGPDFRQNHLPQSDFDEIVHSCQLSTGRQLSAKNRKSRSSHITYRSRKFDLICILAVALFPVLVTNLLVFNQASKMTKRSLGSCYFKKLVHI